MTAEKLPKPYLDTCVVSGLAKNELPTDVTSALLAILEVHKAGRIALVTSKLVHDEISKIPTAHCLLHTVIYSLLADVPLVDMTVRSPPFKPTSFPFGVESAPLLEKLEVFLPDKKDAEHVYQAVRNGASFVITVDRKTMLKHAEAVWKLCGVRLVSPVEFQSIVLRPMSWDCTSS
jgi:hypothetical protein